MSKTKQPWIARTRLPRETNARASSAAFSRRVAANAATLRAILLKYSPKLPVAVALVLFTASSSSAQTVTWTLNNVVFSDGGVVTGFATFDSRLGAQSDWNIQISGGNTNVFVPFTLTPANSTWVGSISAHSNQTFPVASNVPSVHLVLSLLISGAYSLLNNFTPKYDLRTGPFGSSECLQTDGIGPAPSPNIIACRTLVSGSISTTPNSPLTIIPTPLPPACGSYSTTLTAMGGSGGYTWSAVSLPAGFTLNPATGVLSSTGNPAVPANSYSFTVQVMDSAGSTATQPLTLVIPVNFNVLPYAGAPPSQDHKPTTMNASFTPTGTNRSLMTLARAEAACGFTRFDWMQTIVKNVGGVFAHQPPDYPEMIADGMHTFFLDPPQDAYTYDYPCTTPPRSDVPLGYPPGCDYTGLRVRWLSKNLPFFAKANPFYYSLEDLPCGCALGYPPLGCKLSIMSDAYSLNFFDAPHNSTCQPTARCFVLTTQLVGLCDAPSTVCNLPGPSALLYQWVWGSNFNGKTGGIYEEGFSFFLPDPGSGTGGITITSINGAPQTPPTVSCAATPNALWPPNGMSVEVTVTGTVTAGTQAIPPVGTTYAATDEYGLVQHSGGFTADAGGSYSFTVPLIAARNGNDLDGRTYTIVTVATDNIGNVGSCSSVVTVPHDRANP